MLDLGGNVRLNPKLSGTTHNVFGIQVGVSITMLIRHEGNDTNAPATVMYARTPEAWRKEKKYVQLDQWSQGSAVPWKVLLPDKKTNWLTDGMERVFDSFTPMASAKASESVFSQYSLGVSTNRDSVVYDFRKDALVIKVKEFIEEFKGELDRYLQSGKPKDTDSFVDYTSIQWSRNLKTHLHTGDYPAFNESSIRTALYRPFSKRSLYLQDVLVDEPSRTGGYASPENPIIAVTSPGSDKPFMAIASECTLDLHTVGPGAGSQCFPFYIQDEQGNFRENITDWSLAEFRTHYGQKSITKWDIFHYTYALLHHPEYRTRYAANLKRELPRIPFAPDFAQYARIGAELMKLHIEYESQPEYPLQRTETGKLHWRVEKMVLSKDKTQLRYNSFLTLGGIPPEVFEYRLGNRSALEWVIDQYRVSTDKRSGIVNDPNRADDPEYIVRLIGQVAVVSLETVRLVRELAALPLLPPI
ncbi:MAG: type ISP restriction/modification enzyme [Terracidiphilus sp.]